MFSGNGFLVIIVAIAVVAVLLWGPYSLIRETVQSRAERGRR